VQSTEVRDTQEGTMTLRLADLSSSLLGVLGVVILLQGPVAAQYPQASLAQRYESGWENDQLRVRTIAVEPGAQVPAQADGDRVLVFLTADLQGRFPAAEAVWQPASEHELENRGSRRVEAVLIELKNVPARAFGITPPEALPATGAVDVRLLIDNPRVTVTRQLYSPGAYAAEAWHFHPQDAIVVYLRGGYTWLPYVGWGPYRVRRGEIDVVPANTVHSFGNAGSDPLEFVVIFPK
jgi:quercetin dioxygenase-like cupin family protein